MTDPETTPPQVAFTDSWGLVLENAATTISNSDAFQTWVGQDPDDPDAAQAAKQSVVFVTNLEEDLSRPYVLIDLDGMSKDSVSTGTGIDFPGTPAGDVTLTFEAELDSDYVGDAQNACKKFMADVLGIIKDLELLSGTDTNLIFHRIQPAAPCAFSSKKQGEGVDYFQWSWRLSL
jgi:hypothetical protein